MNKPSIHKIKKKIKQTNKQLTIKTNFREVTNNDRDILQLQEHIVFQNRSTTTSISYFLESCSAQNNAITQPELSTI